MNTILQIAIFIILAFVAFELIKHLFMKKISKTILLIFIVLAIFLTTSYFIADNSTFKDNKMVQTGAAIAEIIKDTLPEKITNSPLSPNNLFED